MRVLGIDPGSRITGYGIIEATGDRLVHVASGCLKITANDLPQRMGTIFEGVSNIIRDYSPEVMAIEEVCISRNPRSALILGHARGAAICSGVLLNLPIYEYSPRTIKQATTGRGGADKIQVQHMVKVLLGLREQPSADEADALACAICHSHSARGDERMQAAPQ